MAVLYNSVHFTLLILLLRAKVDDQIKWACCGKGEKLLPRSNFSSYRQYFVPDVRFKHGPDFLFEISGCSR